MELVSATPNKVTLTIAATAKDLNMLVEDIRKLRANSTSTPRLNSLQQIAHVAVHGGRI
jgi:hypothetical protein